VKKIITIIILVAVLLGGVFLYKSKFDHWPWQAGVADNGQPAQENGNNENNAPSQAEKEPRQIIMEDVAARIGQITSEKPVSGSQWQATRFWFVDGSYSTFYVEYEDGRAMRRMLLVADTSQAPQNIKYDIKASFIPGESDWVLKNGKDGQFGQPLILYSFDKNANSWVTATK